MSRLDTYLAALSGIDHRIIADCPPQWKGKYRRGGIGLLIVGMMCMLSGGYAFWIIFENLWFALPFALFWGVLILNLYRLVLITVGNPHIPHKPKYRFPFGSFLFRTVFLLVLGGFVVKPVEVLVFAPWTGPYLEAHRAQVMEEHTAQAARFEQAAIRELFASGDIALRRASSGGYLMTRLAIIHREFPGTWGLTALFLWIFMWPFLARVAWRTRSAYEIKRGELEASLIREEYLAFKAAFTAHMFALTGRDDIWEEPYHDMPFCNQPIVLEEPDFMRTGSLYAYARILANEQGPPRPSA
jgi:hypothetical protein